MWCANKVFQECRQLSIWGKVLKHPQIFYLKFIAENLSPEMLVIRVYLDSSELLNFHLFLSLYMYLYFQNIGGGGGGGR